MADYEVSWSVEIDEAVSPEDAALQAWGIIEDAMHGGPATVLVIRTLDGAHVATLDMASDPPTEIQRHILAEG